MKLNINIRMFFSLLTLLFLMTVFNISYANENDPPITPTLTASKADQTACGGNGTGTITRPGTTNCELEPDEFKMTFTRLELCTSAPTPPSPSIAVGRENCSTFFRNDDGAEVLVVKGVAGQIGESGDYSGIPHGTYTHGIISMKTTFKYKSSILFTGAMGDVDGVGNTTTCVTKAPGGGADTVIYGFHNGLDSAGSNVDCQAGAVAQEIILGVNIMSMEDTSNDCNHTLNFEGTNGTVQGYLVQDDDTLHDDVVTSGDDVDQIPSGDVGCRSGESGGITKIMGVMPLGDPIVIDASTGGLEMEYNTTQSMAMAMTGTANDIEKFEVAFFDFTLKAKKAARSRGSWR
mgnify:CR=1 FL=1